MILFKITLTKNFSEISSSKRNQMYLKSLIHGKKNITLKISLC